jgi:hypothetical protein
MNAATSPMLQRWWQCAVTDNTASGRNYLTYLLKLSKINVIYDMHRTFIRTNSYKRNRHEKLF